MNIQQFEIWFVCWDPSTGSEYQGFRPSLVVTSNNQLEKQSLITVIPLTSNLKNQKNLDFIVRANSTTKLKTDSVLKVGYLSAFDKKRFVKKIGKLDTEEQKICLGALTTYFDIR